MAGQEGSEAKKGVMGALSLDMASTSPRAARSGCDGMLVSLFY